MAVGVGWGGGDGGQQCWDWDDVELLMHGVEHLDCALLPGFAAYCDGEAVTVCIVS